MILFGWCCALLCTILPSCWCALLNQHYSSSIAPRRGSSTVCFLTWNVCCGLALTKQSHSTCFSSRWDEWQWEKTHLKTRGGGITLKKRLNLPAILESGFGADIWTDIKISCRNRAGVFEAGLCLWTGSELVTLWKNDVAIGGEKKVASSRAWVWQVCMLLCCQPCQTGAWAEEQASLWGAS